MPVSEEVLLPVPEDGDGGETQLEISDGRCNGIKRDGTRCASPSLVGYRFCRRHLESGTVAAKRKEGGRYDRGLNGQIANEYQAALQDHYLLHLRDEVAVVTSRINQLLAETEEGINAKSWKEIKTVWDRFTRAYRANDARGQDEFFNQLNDLIIVGKRDSDVWLDVERLFEQRRRLVETEQKYLRSAGQMLTVEAAMVMVAASISALKESVRKYVSSREVQQAIIVDAQYEYAKIVGDIGSGEGA